MSVLYQHEYKSRPTCKPAFYSASLSLDDIQPDNNCSVVKLYEQLGDGASDIGNFTHALEYYHKMVSLSIQLFLWVSIFVN
jgi:hypothetical protein